MKPTDFLQEKRYEVGSIDNLRICAAVKLQVEEENHTTAALVAMLWEACLLARADIVGLIDDTYQGDPPDGDVALKTLRQLSVITGEEFPYD